VTAPRSKVSASLAERGRPEMWANEQEAACLSGLESDKYYSLLPRLEAAGFPRKSSWNNKRFVPAIVDFWARQIDGAISEVTKSEPEPQKGNFTHVKGQRLSAA
jgi:hypothetical protein